MLYITNKFLKETKVNVHLLMLTNIPGFRSVNILTATHNVTYKPHVT